MEPLLPLLGRADRCRSGAFYIQGLLLEGGRKTAAGMAERYGGDEQARQQFVNQSPWDWTVVRQALAVRMAREAGSKAAWVLDDTGFASTFSCICRSRGPTTPFGVARPAFPAMSRSRLSGSWGWR